MINYISFIIFFKTTNMQGNTGNICFRFLIDPRIPVPATIGVDSKAGIVGISNVIILTCIWSCHPRSPLRSFSGWTNGRSEAVCKLAPLLVLGMWLALLLQDASKKERQKQGDPLKIWIKYKPFYFIESHFRCLLKPISLEIKQNI